MKFVEESDRIELCYEKEDEEYGQLHTSKIPPALFGVDTTVQVGDWQVELNDEHPCGMPSENKKKLRICTRPLINPQRVIGWKEYGDAIFETVAKLNAMMQLDPEKGVCFVNKEKQWMQPRIRFGNHIALEVSRRCNDGFQMRVSVMPKALLNVVTLVQVRGWTINFSPQYMTNFNADEQTIKIDTDGAFVARDISTDAWNQSYDEIAQTIKRLNAMMIFKGETVRFEPDGPVFCGHKHTKFEFPDETDTFVIQ